MIMVYVTGMKTLLEEKDDLIMVTLEVTSVPVPQGIEYVLRSTSSNIKVWNSPTKGAIILYGEGEEVIIFDEENQKNVWVEYIGTDGGSAYLEFEARSTQNQEVLLRDRIRFYPFRSVVIALGGEDQVPSNSPPENYGTFRIARDLYLDGYDVHMFDEDGVNNNGSGVAYLEVEDAVQKRNISQIAIFGYSHGGGSTHDLAERLDNNRSNIGTFTIKYTAYIDAIKNWSAEDMRAEDRIPPGTTYLLNYYQIGSWVDGFLDGGPVSGAENYNMDDPRPTETHKTIDDNEEIVQKGIISRLKSKVKK